MKAPYQCKFCGLPSWIDPSDQEGPRDYCHDHGQPPEVEYLATTWPDADVAGWTGPGWYFWDETWAQCLGPFDTRDDAIDALAEYCQNL